MCFLLYPKDFFSGLETSGRGPRHKCIDSGTWSLLHKFRNRYILLWEGNVPKGVYPFFHLFHYLSILVTDLNALDFAADGFGKFIYELHYTGVFVGRGNFLDVILDVFD